MYVPFFGLKQKPFSIAPDPRYLFMSERHREALAHLLYGVQGGGGFVLLTGEIGAGKTTVCRCFLEQIPSRCNVAYIFNPKLSALELLITVCHEFGIKFPALTAAGTPPGVKDYVDGLNEYLLRTHAVGQNNVLIIDEAQNLSSDVLEQLRLLTNLETSERKLLQIVLIGQPELRTMLARPELEQLAQRVIARYHLDALSEKETAQYIAHRLAVAGLRGTVPFDSGALKRIHQLTRGIPRRINLLCDRSLLGAYATGKSRVDRSIVDKAGREVFGLHDAHGEPAKASAPRWWPLAAAGGALVGAAAMAAVHWSGREKAPAPPVAIASSAAAAVVYPRAPAPAAAVLPAAASTVAAPAATASAATASAATASAAAIRSVDELDQLLARAPHDEREALRALAPQWSLLLIDGDPCALAAEQDVRCFRAHGGLALLRLLARPSVLALRDAQDRPVHAVVTGLGHDEVTLVVGKTPVQVPLALLASAWSGDFTTFWRVPGGYSAPLTMGQRGALVDAVGAQLAARQGVAAPRRDHPFDATLRSRVAAFQQMEGLTPDGVAGPTTLMQINRASGVSEPWLAGTAPATVAAAAQKR